MTLLYAALAYMLGLAFARWWWQFAGIPCPLAGELWLIPLALLPCVPLLNRQRRRRLHPPMRWPEEAGFEPPGQPPAPALFAGVALCLIAGFLRYGSHPFAPCWTPMDLAYYNLPPDAAFDRRAQPITLSGIVDSYPLLVDGKQELYVAAQTVQPRALVTAGLQPRAERQVQGSVRVTTSGLTRLVYGQHVAVSGRLVEPAIFDGFSYKDYLAIKGVGSVLYDANVQVLDGSQHGNPILYELYALRAHGEALIDRSLGEPYAALANGMLLGIEANIPDGLYDQFNATGTSHVIVISGSNVALISGVIVAVAARLLGKRRALWPALAAIAAYALLVGGEASVLRASVMGGLFVTATALQRRSTALVSLAAACMAMTLANPLVLWDVGLHLSSMATAGLVLLAPALSGGLRRLLGLSRGWLRVAGEDVLAITLAASLTTLPLSLYYFDRFSLSSVPANLMIAPVQPLILFGGSTALLVGLAGQELLAGTLLWLPWLGLAWTVAVVRWTAGLPFAAVSVGSFGLPQLVVAYAVIGLARCQRELWGGACGVVGAIEGRVGGGRCKGGGGCEGTRSGGESLAVAATVVPPDLVPLRVCVWERLLVSPVSLVGVAVLAALVWVAAFAQPDGRLHVWFLDVGQGDGIFIQTPSGRQVLIDGGSSAQVLLGQLGSVMPFWDRTLDLVVLTHPDADHMAAQVEAAGRFALDAAWETEDSAANPAGAAWRAAVANAGAQIQIQHAGGWADLGDGVALWVLGPPAGGFSGEDADNQNSLVAKLVYGDFSVLLTGDAGTAAEQALVAHSAPLPSTILKVAHHGSKSSTDETLVAAVNAPVAVIQVGADNDYGHPSTETLGRLAGRLVLRNDQDGRVEITSDGRQMWVEKENP